MTWRIPPVGFCAVCLRVRGEERPAMALWKGTGLCQEHLEQVLPDELLAAPVSGTAAAAEALHDAIDGDFLVGAGMSIGNTGEDVPLRDAQAREVIWWAVNTLAAAGLLADPAAAREEKP